LNFTTTYTTGAATPALVDFSLFALFQQIRIESNGQILEQIDEPGVLYNTMSQWNWSTSEINKNNAKQCSMQDNPVVGTGVINKPGESISTGGTKISLPLYELMGIFSGDKCIPLMNTSGLTVVLTLAPLTARVAFAATAVTTDNITVSDIFITGTCYEAGPDYEKALAAVKSGNKYNEVSILMKTAKRYIGNVAGAALTNAQIQVNDRSKSALGVWVVGRVNSDVTAQASYSSSSSTFISYLNHAMVINGTQYPTAQISTLGELAEESYKVANGFKKLSPEPYASGGFINRLQITDAAGGEGTGTGATCCLAVNLSKTGYDDKMFGAGMDLSTSSSPNVLQVSYTPVAASTVTIWVLSQALLHINGLGMFSTEI
jgi:hypothetical protein